MNKIGQRIYELRLKNNLSQDTLADKLGVSRQAISKWENQMSVPEIDKIVQMSEIFDVSLDYLIKGKESFSEKTIPEEAIKEAGFSKGKIKQIFGFVFLIFGILMLLVNLIFSVPLVVEGLFLIFHKETDIKLIIGCSMFIFLITPIIMIGITGFILAFVR